LKGPLLCASTKKYGRQPVQNFEKVTIMEANYCSACHYSYLAPLCIKCSLVFGSTWPRAGC